MEVLRVLCVDLDGTLVFNDMVQESIVLIIKKNPLYLFLFPIWLLKGFAHFKQEVAKRIQFDPSLLPYNQAMIDYVKSQRDLGRKTVLATASDQAIAKIISDYLGIFDEVLGSDGKKSYTGKKKLLKMQECYGVDGFDYAGNSSVDLNVWPGSGEVIIVTNDLNLLKKARKLNKALAHFPSLDRSIGDFFQLIRFFRWRHNLLIFVPLILARNWHWQTWLSFLPAFFILGLLSSSAALFSDMFDLNADRAHSRKRHRPLAAGKWTVRWAASFAGILFVLSAFLALIYSVSFFEFILGYLLMALFYSLYLRRWVITRVLGLMVLTLLPIFAGVIISGGYRCWIK